MIFITGATGCLGRELLARLIYRELGQDLAVLVRAKSLSAAEDRLRNVLRDSGLEFSSRSSFQTFLINRRIQIVLGDLTLERFGLGDSEYSALASKCERIYHSAANTKFYLPLAQARTDNVASTKYVLDLVSTASSSQNNPVKKKSFFHISTSYVAGTNQGVIRPGDIGGDFRNSYEQSKAEAEELVNAYSDQIRTVIFRPSIIVGDSNTGRTSAFNVIYYPIRLIVQGICKTIPAAPDAPFDVVPVNYVSDAIHFLSNLDSPRKCYHLTVGLGRESSPSEILRSLLVTIKGLERRYSNCFAARLLTPSCSATELLINSFKCSTSFQNSVKFLSSFLEVKLPAIVHQFIPFVPYLLSNPRFDDQETKRDLAGSLSEVPTFDLYAERIFNYCLETDWGKKPWPNEHNFAAWYEQERLPNFA